MGKSTQTQTTDLEAKLEAMIQELNQRQTAMEEDSNAKFAKLTELIRGISLQNQSRTSTGSEAESESRQSGTKNSWGKSTRLEFPKFSGDGFDGWLMRAEYFFEVADVQLEERVKISALHLEDKALQWHQGYVSLKGATAYKDWKSCVDAIAARFGSKAYEDPLSDLRNLKQVTPCKNILIHSMLYILVQKSGRTRLLVSFYRV